MRPCCTYIVVLIAMEKAESIVCSHQTSCTIVVELVSLRTSSFVIGILDVPSWVMQSLAVAPYKFPRSDHHGGMSFSHLTIEAQDPRAQLHREGIEGLSFSPPGKILRRSPLHNLVEILWLQCAPYTSDWKN